LLIHLVLIKIHVIKIKTLFFDALGEEDLCDNFFNFKSNLALTNISGCVEINEFYLKICRCSFRNV
jgi:hypothetical protein